MKTNPILIFSVLVLLCGLLIGIKIKAHNEPEVIIVNGTGVSLTSDYRIIKIKTDCDTTSIYGDGKLLQKSWDSHLTEPIDTIHYKQITIETDTLK